MKITVLIPHFRTLKMTAYSVAQFIKYKGDHDVKIIVIDNSYPDESIKGLEPLKDEITIIKNDVTDRQQSHGVAYELAMPYVETDYFITAESDSYPTREGWIDYYENLIKQGVEFGGSLLKLSGGTYIHPCGAVYKKELFYKAKEYCESQQYSYFPNMARHTDFDCHFMVHNRILQEFLGNPSRFITLAKGYEGLTKEEMIAKRDYYKSITMPFHNGMGDLTESLQTFGQRSIESDSQHAILKNIANFIHRIGYEPGQWLCYWLIANKHKGAAIPTEIKWMRNRGFQQQEYTLNDAGFRHEWGVSAYHKAEGDNVRDVIDFKAKRVEDLYNSLEEKYKI